MAAFAVSVSVMADGDKGISGRYVVDESVTVPAYAYTAFSTVYNGKRYYLGVDTVQAKLGKDTVIAYDAPNYATMWVAGPLWSPTGALLPNKDYTRWVKSVWIEENCKETDEVTPRKRYLSVGPDKGTYSLLLLTDTANATMWHTAKDFTIQSQFMHGFVYYYSDDLGVDVYRYFNYDPIYGFSRLHGEMPIVSQRISVWDRTTGNDVVCDLRAATTVFGWETYGNDTTKLPITSQVFYYEGIDRFRSRADLLDVIVKEPLVISNQEVLMGEPYNLYGYYEWASNKREGSSYAGTSLMPHYTLIADQHEHPEDPSQWTYAPGWRDSIVMWVSDTNYDRKGDIWLDTVYAIGSAPFDILRKPAGGGEPTPGDYTDHSDWLRQHFFIKGEHFVDSIKLTRRTFHHAPYVTLNSSFSPADHVFPYFAYDAEHAVDTLNGGTTATTLNTTQEFTIIATYEGGNNILYANNDVAQLGTPTVDTVPMTELSCIRDTIWVYDKDGNHVMDGDKPTYSDIILYDTLVVEALLTDGTTNAIIGGEGSSSASWIKSVRLTAKNKIEVVAGPYTPEANTNRVALIRYTYRYIRSAVEGDRASVTRIIWVSQKWRGADDGTLYTFHHKTGAGSTNKVDDSHAQKVHTKRYTLPGIPGTRQLPVHHDHWGYYRWYEYNGEDPQSERAVNHSNWAWINDGPKNQDVPEDVFMPINSVTDPASRGCWDISGTYFPTHFDKSHPTPIPSVVYPESSTHTGTIVCDVSAYTDIDTYGSDIGALDSLTEPTLSYRNIFEIQPAYKRADEMSACRGDGSGANWMEKRKILVPKGREFSIQPLYPVHTAPDEAVEEGHLEYVYYFNTGNNGDDMGLEGTLDKTKSSSYSYVGQKRNVSSSKRLKLLTIKDLNDMTPGTTKKVLLVNPRKISGPNGYKTSGYVVGRSGSEDIDALDWYSQGTTVNDTADLRRYLMTNRIFNNTNCEIILTKSANQGYFTLSQTNYPLYSYVKIAWTLFEYTMRWISGNERDVTGDKQIQYTGFSSCSDGDMVAECKYSNDGNNIADSTTLFKLHMQWSHTFSRNGYITAFTWRTLGTDRYVTDFHIEDGNGNSGSSAINQGWMIYEIIEANSVDYEEIPRWEKWNGSTWSEVARIGTPTSDYTMLSDGSLQITNPNVFTAKNQMHVYRLRTEHFQLSLDTVISRDPNEEGPKEGYIISQEDIERDYTILYQLDMETWPASGTERVTAYNGHLGWDMTEFGYHYPLSVIPASQRVDTIHATGNDSGETTAEMPMKGEYAFINKFIVPAAQMNASNVGEEYECRNGAANGYMLCFNAPRRRTMLLSFEFDQMSCSNQQIYFMADICNPVNNSYDPQITLDMEGTNDGINWTRLYRYKTGKIPYSEDKSKAWYQIALPIDRNIIKGYQKFRCMSYLNGGPNKNCYLLVDRVRFVEKSRGFSVFQNKATCQKDETVTAIIRLDYTADTEFYQPGKLVAYQFQKWVDVLGWISLTASDYNSGTGTYTRRSAETTEIYPGYHKDGFTVQESVETASQKSLAGNDYGYIQIPETNYNPNVSNTVEGQSELRRELIEQVITKLGLTGDAAKAHRDSIDETRNIRTFTQVVDRDYNDFGPDYNHAHIKSFVNEGTEENPHWVLYVITRLPANLSSNKTFRIGMTLMDDVNDHPTFTEVGCATFREFKVKQATALRLNGEAWINHTRYDITHDVPDVLKLLPANETYRASVALQIEEEIAGKTTKNPRCKFDMLHTHDSIRNIASATANLAFQRRYGCTREAFQDAMETFRADDERNRIRDVSDWSEVKPIDFAWSENGATAITSRAREKYNILNKLILDGVLELGLAYRDIYMGDRADSWFYLMPIPASGWFDVENGDAAGTGDTTLHASVCNDTLWLELHSEEPTAKLRFGFDSRIGDTYIVPVIRASRSDAIGAESKHLNVRVAESWTSAENNIVILGWAATELIDSNDPDWTGTQVFKYQQDKNAIGYTPSVIDYYGVGSVIQFTPVAEGNNIILKAGYWYQFRTPFYAALSTEVYAGDASTPTGHTQFILAIAPDTVTWTPKHEDQANYWNDDANWTPMMAKTPEDGFKAKVPMGDTKVIIPKVKDGQLPVVMDLVVNEKDTLEYGYKRNTCNKILFKPSAMILGQERLDYDKAFVDISITTGNWQTFSPALKGIYSGDMFIPFASDYTMGSGKGAPIDTVDFEPKAFPQGSGFIGNYNPRVYPFAFYQGFYNSTVSVAYNNTDKDGWPVSTTTSSAKNAADWVRTNLIDTLYHPGKVSVITGFDESDENGHEIIVRLPKLDESYYTFGKTPNSTTYQASGKTRNVPKPEGKNLAFDKETLGAADGITYTLQNASASEIFFFGNPTMALIDVYQLCKDNKDVLSYTEGPTGAEQFKFTAYKLIDGTTSSYTVRDITAKGQYFIAPQRAIGLIANSERTTLDITLKPSALVAITGEGIVVSSEDVIPEEEASPARRRSNTSDGTEAIQKRLHITASNETDDGIKKAYLTLGEQADASRGFVKGEDALSLASGKHYFNYGSFSTPISLYTIAD
ncbi:MAG: hypothetical protein IKR37_02955, partial [Paludibacteraceae bacterium]|nr:hypothetical protein [Paludibacteraceae bacterium]